MEAAQIFDLAATVTKLEFETNKTLLFLRIEERFDQVAIKGNAVEWTERRLHQATVRPKIGASVLTEPGDKQLPAVHQVGKQVEHRNVVFTRSAALPEAGGADFGRADQIDNGMQRQFAGSYCLEALRCEQPSRRGYPVEFLRHCGYRKIPRILIRHIVSCIGMNNWPEQAVSRVLFPRQVTLRRAVTIPLGPPLPTASSSQPGSTGGQPLTLPY